MNTIYGAYEPTLHLIKEKFVKELSDLKEQNLYEHISARVKSVQSMEEKCKRKEYPVDTYSALRRIKDSIGVRIICLFREDVYRCVEYIRALPSVTVVNEKDYIKKAKENGYRSYHMIVEVETEYPDIDGNANGHYFIELQLRTIAMDTWAALEHEIKYKKNIKKPEIIIKELKRCADELAACDISLQAIRDIANMEDNV